MDTEQELDFEFCYYSGSDEDESEENVRPKMTTFDENVNCIESVTLQEDCQPKINNLPLVGDNHKIKGMNVIILSSDEDEGDDEPTKMKINNQNVISIEIKQHEAIPLKVDQSDDGGSFDISLTNNFTDEVLTDVMIVSSDVDEKDDEPPSIIAMKANRKKVIFTEDKQQKVEQKDIRLKIDRPNEDFMKIDGNSVNSMRSK